MGIVLFVLLAIFYVRRAGLLLWALGSENRKLRKGLRGYERMEQDHLELAHEIRERNRFQSELPVLIARLNEEKTLSGIGQHLIDFTTRMLEASEVSLFLMDASSLVLRDNRGIGAAGVRVPVGEGRIGAVARFRRIMTSDDFQNLDATTRSSIGRGRIDTVLAAPLVAHGEVIGVINVGGIVQSAPSMRKEILQVIAQLGATALENQLNFERLEREATTDGLTKLSNVRNFKEKARQEISRAARFGRPCSLFLFDIDHFKHYNDRNGHPAGDEGLRITAQALQSSVRVTDLPARYGGEEFVVLLPETDRSGALQFAEKIRLLIAATEYPHRENQPLGVLSISGGVATFPEDGQSVEDLVKRADEALYRCKEEGRNRVQAANGDEPEMIVTTL